MTARDNFRAEVAEALTDWRLGCIPPRPSDVAGAIFREGLADVIRFRLRIAYMPLFQGLERIERRVGILADLKREPWAQPSHAANQKMEMAKKKDGNGNGIGHNSNALTDDEKRALTLHHKRAYEASDALVEKAKADRTAIADLAKSDLGKGALADIKDMILADNPKKMKAVLERAQRLARWAGLKVGSQPQLFEAATVDHGEEGKTAGMSGANCEAPKNLAQDAAQKWIMGWHEGQTILMAAFKKKRPVEAPVTTSPNDVKPESAVAGTA